MPSDLPLPPVELRFIDPSEKEYYRFGNRTASELADLTSLDPADTVLDVGSGYGRVASALWQRGYRGRNVGVDNLERHIQWCTEYVTPATDSAYSFQHLGFRNDRSNPTGHLEQTEVSLDIGVRPDVVLLASVFTRMYADAIVHYLREIRSILPLDGRVMATFFRINESQQIADAAGLSKYPLTHQFSEVNRCWTLDDPLYVVAYDETWVHQQIHSAGSEAQATHLGSWCGRHDGDRGPKTPSF